MHRIIFFPENLKKINVSSVGTGYSKHRFFLIWPNQVIASASDQFSVGALWVAKGPMFLQLDNQDTDQILQAH